MIYEEQQESSTDDDIDGSVRVVVDGHDDDLANVLSEEIEQARNYIDTEAYADRRKAMDYYYRRARDDDRDGYSKVQSSDVYDVVEGLSTAISNVFVSTPNAIEFVGKGAEDEGLAKQRTKVLQHVFYAENFGELLHLESIKDGLLLKHGFLTWRWNKKRRLTVDRYKGLTEREIAMLQDNESVTIKELTPAGMIPGPPQMTPHGPMPGASMPIFDVVAHVVKSEGSVLYETVPPERVMVSPWSRSCDIQKAPFVVIEDQCRREDLLAEGYDEELVEKIGFGGGRLSLYGDLDRREHAARMTGDDWVTIYRGWISRDLDGDGIEELRYFVMADDVVLENEITDEIAISSWTPIVQPHEFLGRAVADDVTYDQDMKTVIQRQTLDNLYQSNMPGWQVDDSDTRVNIQDFLEPAIGRVYRAPLGSAHPVSLPFVAQHSLPILEYIDSQKESRTGFTRYSQGLDAKSLNKTARGMSLLTNMSQQRVGLLVTLYGKMCLKPAILGGQKLLARYGDRKMTVRLTAKEYIEVDPREWREQYDLTLNVGQGTVDKEQQLAALQHITMAQQAAVQGGGLGTLVTPKNLYNAQSRVVEAAGYQDASLFWTDPGDKMPPPKPDPKAEAEKAKMQADVQKFQAQTQIDQQKIQMQAQMDQQKIAAEMELARWKVEQEMQLKLQIHAMTLQSNGGIEAQRIEASTKPATQVQFNAGEEMSAVVGQVSQAFEMMQAQQMQAMQMFAQAVERMSSAVELMSGPKEVVRDKSGKIIGSRSVMQ